MLVACDQGALPNPPPEEFPPAGENPPPEELPILMSDSSAAFVSNGVSRIRLSDIGLLWGGNWLTEGTGIGDGIIYGVITSGIWVAKASPPYRVTTTSHLGWLPGVELWNQAADSSKIFLIGETTQEQRYANWPAWLGAPVHADGSLKKYGSEMAWGVFRPTTDTQYGETLEGIRRGDHSCVSIEQLCDGLVWIFGIDGSRRSQDACSICGVGVCFQCVS